MAKLNPEAFLKQTKEYQAQLEAASRMIIKVGLPKENVGGKAYGNGTPVIAVGAVHEFGGTWNHPGGTPYGFNTKRDAKEGRVRFLKKGSGFKVIGVTKAHRITMPQRSFLRVPFLVKIIDIEEELAKQFKLVGEGKVTARVAAGRVGVRAVNISKKAFSTNGYGKWKPSKKKSGLTLVDKSILRNSITFHVTEGI